MYNCMHLRFYKKEGTINRLSLLKSITKDYYSWNVTLTVSFGFNAVSLE